MSRSSRSRLDSRSRSPENIRKNPEPLLKKGSADEALPWPSQYSTNFSSSNKSETNAHPRPSTPEEWLDFAQRTIWEAATAADAIQVLVAEPDVLEFLITANEDIRDLVYESVCGASFPTKRARWASSISCYFFRRFQVYLSRLPPDLADRTIDDASRQISALVGALSALDHITFEDDGAQEEAEPEDAFFKVKSKKSQKQRKANKASRARTNTVLADPRLFMAVDMDVPVTSDEAMVAEICILERIQETLEVLLTAFENPNLAPHAKALFFKQPLQYVPARLAPEPNTLVEDKTSTVAESEVGAYPHIRPLAAAKYFDEGTGLGAWNIIISGRAVKDLRHIQKDGSHVFGMVYKKIMELSQGFFSDDNQKRLLGLDTEVPIYEAKVSRDLRIVYQVDLDTDIDAKVDKQILKIFGVYTHAQLDNRLWALVSHYHINRRGKEYRRRCLHRETPRARGQNVTLPGHFKHEEGMEAPVEPPPTNSVPLEGMTEQDFLDLHSLIALEKFIPMSQSLVTSILNNSDANHVFHVSAKEKEIIYHESACFVLGRSGTGKTTSILFKMIGIEKLFEQMEGVAKPRQVFVTQSRVLAQRVQEYYQSLVRSSSGTVNSDSREDEQDEEVLADLDDEDASTFGLPTKYSMLEDKHFPMFVTYDQLCSLLEADFGFQFRRSARTKVHAAAEKRFAIAEVADVKIDLDREVEVEIESSATEVVSPTDIKEELQQAQRAAVTFEIFVAAYWPHFDFRLTKGFDPALVYIIKLYGVYTHAQLDNRLWALISHYHLNRRGKEYRRRCLHRETPRARGQNVTLPAHFKHEEDIEAPVEPPPTNSAPLKDMTEKDFLDLHSLIALEKFIPMSQSLITSILNNSDTNHVFHVSAKEKEIIYHESACFVLGRSGTGKTTSILFKMIGIEKLFEQMDGVKKPRQAFVTQSRVLAQRVQEYYQSLVTSSSEAANGDSRADEQEEEVLADLDDEDAHAFGLPAKYSMLEDKHFPLFITYDQASQRMLEADFDLKFRRSARTKAHIAAEKRFAITEVADVKIDLDQEVEAEFEPPIEVSSPTDTKEDIQQAQQAAVTFEVFVAAYWPHFDFRLTKGLDPALVYSEFLGIIEGSESALQSPNGTLNREEYASLSHRKSSFASQRDRVYDLYELYRKRKQFLGGYDSAERTHALVNALNLGVPGQKIDCFAYIDMLMRQAQDNLLIDTKLFHSLSNNPHGIFMAGDTAQTISAGSSFRFEDLKAFLWRLEEQDEAVLCGKRNAIHPALFHLALNYRSHGGIVNCAGSVVQLISDLFPYSIDKLGKETGLIDGPKPLFFSGWGREFVRFEQFLQGEADTRIDFGASQVILVRNEAARTALRAQVGEIGLILTLYESKGLEFDDVLLYNFFEDSVPSASTWRVILHGLDGARLGPIPRFDEVRHAVICTELKNLYVGLTRARNHCWVWDVSDKAEPMKFFWQEKGLINLCGPDDPMPQLSVSSSEADWAKSGRLLFNKSLYPQAMFCFEKAGLYVERDIAGAYQARKEARLLLAKSADRQIRRAAFKGAAKDFLGCAILSKGKQQISCYLRAAECYIQAEEWKLAAESYLSAEQFDLSARNFRRAGCFDEAVEIVKKYRDRLKSKDLVDEILGIAKLEFLRKAKYQKASELFKDVDEQLEYMEDFGFDAARIHVLELHKRFADAASVAFQGRNILEGVRLLLLSNEDNHKLQAVTHAIHGLWTLIPYHAQVTPENDNSVRELLRQVSAIESKFLSEDGQRVAINAKSLDRILAISRSNALLARASEALLGFAHCSKYLTTLQQANLEDFNTKSILALSYYNGLVKLSRTIDLTAVESQRLLGFGAVAPSASSKLEMDHSEEPSEFWIYSSSCLFEPAKRLPGVPEPEPLALGLSALVISESRLHRLIVDTVTKQLNNQVWTMNSVTTPLHALRLCLDFAVIGKCTRPGCGRQEVISAPKMDRDWQKHFNSRLRAHILQALIVQSFHPQNPEDEGQRRRSIRIWMQKIHETLFPHFPPLGNVLCADSSLVTELNRAADVLSRWCEHRLYELSPRNRANRPYFLSEVLLALQLGYRVQRGIFEGYVAKLHSCELVQSEPIMTPIHSERSIIHDLITYYGEENENALQGALVAIRHIVNHSLKIELNVLIHFLESIGRDIIIHGRALALYRVDISDPNQPQAWVDMRTKALDGLLVPRSWALDIIKSAKQAQTGWEVLPFLDVLYEVLRLLKFEDDSDSPFYLFAGRMGIILRGVMSLRICRLLYLIGENLVYHPQHKSKIRVSIAAALVPTAQGSIHTQLCGRLSRMSSWLDLFSTLAEGPLNRGADEFVRLAFRHSKSRPRRLMNVRTIIYENIKPELEGMLSFVTLNATRGPALNPEAKPFVLNQNSKNETTQADIPETTDYKDEDQLPEEETDDAPSDIFGGLIPAQLAFKVPATSKPERKLTESERKTGVRLLNFYRRYKSRKQKRERQAVHVIWSYYSRYRRRTHVVLGSDEDSVRKLHPDYKRAVEDIECPLLLDKLYRHHAMVLQGPMPHVLVFLRGLEQVTHSQKNAIKKRLQKVQHEELEKVQARMTLCNALVKRFKKLMPLIQPGSKVLRTLSGLKDRVGEVDAMRHAVSETFGEGCISANLEIHYSLGVKVILMPSPEPTAPKPPRPELNASDVDGLY
ncbi:unnamed protein product [Rhizoctonia solani]|uniref:UvrD-like helicase C-terminal domain-containing protein n=1 Tax=Rhizoctonia solani TaxID=456999 RepID=A0A8H3ANZ2_9AGAM|nr:unnamed protein product [Rhizoctonia solani]